MINEGLFPNDFFVSIPAQIYHFVRLLIYFVFEHNLLSPDIHTPAYFNPFSGEDVVSISFDIPNIASGAFQLILAILEELGLTLHLTFWDVLVGPILLFVLVYAFIKYIIPVS